MHTHLKISSSNEALLVGNSVEMHTHLKISSSNEALLVGNSVVKM